MQLVKTTLTVFGSAKVAQSTDGKRAFFHLLWLLNDWGLAGKQDPNLHFVWLPYKGLRINDRCAALPLAMKTLDRGIGVRIPDFSARNCWKMVELNPVENSLDRDALCLMASYAYFHQKPFGSEDELMRRLKETPCFEGGQTALRAVGSELVSALEQKIQKLKHQIMPYMLLRA